MRVWYQGKWRIVSAKSGGRCNYTTYSKNCTDIATKLLVRNILPVMLVGYCDEHASGHEQCCTVIGDL